MDTNVASARYIAKRYLDYFRSESGFNVHEFQEKIHREININISIKKAYKCKGETKLLIEGRYTEQYKLLWDYITKLNRSNPGSDYFYGYKA